MFDFEKLIVYQKAKENHILIYKMLKQNKLIEKHTKDQLKRASESIVLNIAEGSSKFSKKDKANFYTIARGSVNECVAVLQLLQSLAYLDQNEYKDFYNKFEEIAKMLSSMIFKLK